MGETQVIDGRTLRAGRPGAPRRHWKDQGAPEIEDLVFDRPSADLLHTALDDLGLSELRTAIDRDTTSDLWDAARAAKLRSTITRALIRAGHPATLVAATVAELVDAAGAAAGRDFRTPPVDDWEFSDEPEVTGYRMQHRAPVDDGYSLPVTRILEAFGDPQILERPGRSQSNVDQETLGQIRRALADPGAELTVYRSAPADVTQINDGDWVSLSRAYAELHGSEDGWPVLAMNVNAAQVFTDGNDLNEFGFVAVPR